jgi:hypothetical protein
VVADLQFCSGPRTQKRSCNEDPMICDDAPNDPCMDVMTRGNRTYGCSETCSAMSDDYNCNPEDSQLEEEEPICYCDGDMVFDERAQECVHPNECECYVEQCDLWIPGGSYQKKNVNRYKNGGPACCPEMFCSCVGGRLECEGSCPIDCVATEWSEWTMCDENCLKSRERCIVQHGDYGGAPCEGGERETEQCDGKRGRCQNCVYNGTVYAENDVVYSEQCYNYICVDDTLRKELNCVDGPSSQEDCSEGEVYVPPSNPEEAESNNCCGRCERRPCSYEENPVNLIVESCIPKSVDIGRCSGSCSPSSMSLDSPLPRTLAEFGSTVSLHASCECCKGTVETMDVELVCDGVIQIVKMGKLTSCQCDACGDAETVQQLQMFDRPAF